MKLISFMAISFFVLAAWYASTNQARRALGPATQIAESDRITITEAGCRRQS